jgi:hypothetical protein
LEKTVSWPNRYSLVASMEKMVGGDFETSLASMKSVAETASPKK